MDNILSFIRQYQVDKQEFQKVMMQMNILRNEYVLKNNFN